MRKVYCAPAPSRLQEFTMGEGTLIIAAEYFLLIVKELGIRQATTIFPGYIASCQAL